MMIPQNDSDVLKDMTVESQPSYTYAMQLENDRIIGNADKLTAIQQAIFKILNTERYDSPIYSWNYGVELKSLFGMPVTYCVPEIERRITEALMQDDRITKVYDFQFSYPKRRVVAVQFKVKSTEGTIEAEREVSI